MFKFYCNTLYCSLEAHAHTPSRVLLNAEEENTFACQCDNVLISHPFELCLENHTDVRFSFYSVLTVYFALLV